MLIMDKREVEVKPIKIGYDIFNERTERTNADNKAKLQAQAELYFQKYKIDIECKETFCQSFTDYFRTQFEKTYSDKLPEFIPLHKKIEMTGINISEIKALENAFKDIRTPYDIMTKDIPKDRDYNIYATNKEQQTRLKACRQLIKGVKALLSLGIPINIHEVVQNSRRCLKVENGELIPSIHYVLNGKSVYQ